MKPFSVANRPDQPAIGLTQSAVGAGPLFRIDEVTVQRGAVTVLDRFSAEIDSGARTVVTGPSGTGKSSLLRLLIRLDDPDTGRITFGGVGLTRYDVLGLRRQVQLVAQQPTLLTDTVLGDLRCAQPDLVREDGAALLERTGLPAGFCDRATAGLSGGEAARVCLARALAMDPQVLLLDEPTAALDQSAAAAIEHTLHEFTTGGRTVVLVSHDPAQIRRLADQVITLDHGRRTTVGERS